MLVNLRTIHKPDTLAEAAELLQQPGIYPIYGTGAALIRNAGRDVEEAVDLSAVIKSNAEVDADGTLLIAAGATLESLCTGPVAEFDATTSSGITDAIKAEVPLTLRNALTLGDVFMECNAGSILLTLLSGLQTEVHVYDGVSRRQFAMRMRDWFSLVDDQRRSLIVTDVRCAEYALWRTAFEKVSRTPADAPIVVAVAFTNAENPQKSAFAMVGGLTDHPAHYVSGMQATTSNYKGSAEYRTEMARVLSERAVSRVIELAKLS